MTTKKPELEYEGDSHIVRVAAVDGRGLARFFIGSALSPEEAEEAAERFTGWYHALPGGMNYTGGIDRALDRLVAAVTEAIIAYDASGDHRHDGSPVPGDCVRCNVVASLPNTAVARIQRAHTERKSPRR
jgi:hypothetical protein